MKRWIVVLLAIWMPTAVHVFTEEKKTCDQWLDSFRENVNVFIDSHYDAHFTSALAYDYVMGTIQCPDHPGFYVVYADSICFGEKTVILKRLSDKEVELKKSEKETGKRDHKEYLELAACFLHDTVLDLPRAAETLGQVEKLKPTSPAIDYFKADIAYKQNKPEEAQTFMQRYAKKGTACLEATRLNDRIQARLTFGSNVRDRNTERLKRMKATGVKKPDVKTAESTPNGEAKDLMAQAKAAEAAGEYAKAVDDARMACQKDPSNKEYKLYLRSLMIKARGARQR